MNAVLHGGKLVTHVAERFEAQDLGTPFKVILCDAVSVTHDSVTGKQMSYKIPDLDGLLQTIVITRILHPRRLSGGDIKFIRKAISVKQKDLAVKIDMSVEHLSRCEAGVLVMSPGSEKLLRIFALKTAMKIDRVKPCDAKTRLEDALDRVFDVMKPVPVFDVKDELELHFYRARPERGGRQPISDALQSRPAVPSPGDWAAMPRGACQRSQEHAGACCLDH